MGDPGFTCEWPDCRCDEGEPARAATRCVIFVTPDLWRELPGQAYALLGMLNRWESEPRENLPAVMTGLTLMRELLKRRPAEFGGPMEVR